MKRIFTYTFIILALAGCRITSPSNPSVTNSDLTFYTTYQLGRCISMPAELTSVVLDFDQYLKKSEEEMLLDENFYGVASYLGENTYRISHHHIGISCTVDTDGKSILDPGTVWEFSNIGYFGYYADAAVGMSYDIYINEESALKMVADSTWSFTSKGIESTLHMLKTDTARCWNIHGKSVENTEGSGSTVMHNNVEGMYSISVTGEEGMKMWCIEQQIDEKYSSRSISYSGTFATDIYKGNDLIDFCTFAFMPGFNSTVTTSRDLVTMTDK